MLIATRMMGSFAELEPVIIEVKISTIGKNLGIAIVVAKEVFIDGIWRVQIVASVKELFMVRKCGQCTADFFYISN
ncbi:hypothetical protein KKF84_09530 [Myxococcota bacterium]|nr:hypothetical protein [Myxococcota bacterium]MBU1535551.1 hypothetical protein [Myxococcota bacterium]